MARKKLKRSDLATLARQLRVISLEEQDRLLGKGPNDYFTFEEFLTQNFSLWDGGNVYGLETINGQLYYTGGTTATYIPKEYIGGTQCPEIFIGSNDTNQHDEGIPFTVFLTALTDDNFVGYNDKDPKGCLNRCKDMLRSVGVSLDNGRIAMTNRGRNGMAGGTSDSFDSGMAAIDQSLRDGKPIVVGVDYRVGTSNNDGMTDHFIVIVGATQVTLADGSVATQYRFFDPQTKHKDVGTSQHNILTVKDGKLTGVYTTADGQQHNYTVTTVRTVK